MALVGIPGLVEMVVVAMRPGQAWRGRGSSMRQVLGWDSGPLPVSATLSIVSARAISVLTGCVR